MTSRESYFTNEWRDLLLGPHGPLWQAGNADGEEAARETPAGPVAVEEPGRLAGAGDVHAAVDGSDGASSFAGHISTNDDKGITCPSEINTLTIWHISCTISLLKYWATSE